MKNTYSDILSRISEQPTWWDDNGVPRFGEFHPELAPSVYSSEVVLYQIECQTCGTPFRVTKTWDRWDGDPPSAKIPDLHYGDPPNSPGCCDVGITMNSMSIKVLEFWGREKNGWARRPELEVELSDVGWMTDDQTDETR